MSNSEIKENYKRAYEELNLLADKLCIPNGSQAQKQAYSKIKAFQKASEDVIRLLCSANDWLADSNHNSNAPLITNCSHLHECSLANSSRVRNYSY
jgi:hypothetical protein